MTLLLQTLETSAAAYFVMLQVPTTSSELVLLQARLKAAKLMSRARISLAEPDMRLIPIIGSAQAPRGSLELVAAQASARSNDSQARDALTPFLDTTIQ
jgi:hypothetical protein